MIGNIVILSMQNVLTTCKHMLVVMRLSMSHFWEFPMGNSAGEVDANPDIVDTNSEYFCVYCLKGLLMPKQLACGHRICSHCLEQIKEKSQITDVIQCPERIKYCCEDSLIDEIYLDKSAEKDMKMTQVYCPNKHFGCNSIFLYSQLQNHLKNCCTPFLAEFNAPAINPLKKHLVYCKYVHIGCGEFSERKSDLAFHESNVAVHMDIVLKNLKRVLEENLHVKSIISKLNDAATAIQLWHNDLQTKSLQLDDLVKELQKIESKQIETLSILKEIPSWLEVPDTSVPFILQEETRNHLIHHDKTIGEHDVSLADINLRLEVMENTGYLGVLVWKLTEYWAKKHATGSRSISSPPFFTSRYGYKMFCRLYLNGDGPGKGSHLSIFFALLKSDYDDILPWPFSKRVTFILIDQNNTKKDVKYSFEPDGKSPSFQKPKDASNVAFGCPLFVRHSVLENLDGTYLKENMIFLKIVVGDTDKQIKQSSKK